ncbi:MAG: AAA family ATPase [Spirosomataceae bacterium]
MKKILILIGISGSGKSTWAKQFCRDNPNWLRINKDDIRKSMLSVSLNEYHTWEKSEKYRIEKLVDEQQNLLIINALHNGWNVLIDNTHLKLSYLNEYRKMLVERFEEVEISYQLFEVPLDECLKNDQNRMDVVGESVILQQVEKLAIMKKNFKFQPETHVRESFEANQDKTLPTCVIVDIDGTVAEMQGRYAYDWHLVAGDKPKRSIIDLVKLLKNAGHQIIFFSGRDEICRHESTTWITKHFNWNKLDFQLFMRKNKDMRKDSDIKFELYNEHIRGQYFVELVIDDRQQVVDMWRRKLGLTCLQVDYGNF